MTSESAGPRDVDHLLAGAVESHMHAAPSAFPRHDTDFSAARKARDRDMRAIVVKSHHYETASRAQMARAETGFPVIGGITLNEWVGGLNPLTVDGVASYDGSVVWMPSITATNHLENAAIDMFADAEQGPEGISVLDESGGLTDDARAVLDRIAAHDLVVGTSHLAPRESLALVDAAMDRGVSDVLVTHPFANFLDYSHDQLREITDLGATLEFHYNCTTEMMGHAATIEDFVAAMDVVGVENVVMATDGGATVNPPAMEQFERFVREMRAAGVSEAEIRTMTAETPSRIFGLD